MMQDVIKPIKKLKTKTMKWLKTSKDDGTTTEVDFTEVKRVITKNYDNPEEVIKLAKNGAGIMAAFCYYEPKKI